jgi:uncharacterized protein YndB with AHSA1/START domain
MYTSITVQVVVPVSPATAWHIFTTPEHITQWYFATPDWHAPSASNDLRAGGAFSTRMEAKDGSFGFDFEGVYDEVLPFQLIRYTLADGRQVTVSFSEEGGETLVIQTFDAENENSLDLQQQGWQAILNSFSNYLKSIS